jgi:4,5-dihydroxyphthalate decarboxylase
VLEIALGDYPHTRELKSRLAGSPSFNFVNIQPITKAFAPMARQQAHDISEMALVTFLQAKAYGKPLVLLPFAVAARSQEISLICLAKNDAIRGPADLVGKRVGVRAYSQTTGAWIRGILGDEFGIRPEDIRWVTFEDAHVAEYKDPPFAERAKPGSDMMAMLRAGELDAVIVGNDKPVSADLKDVYPDAEAAGRQFKQKHGFVPVNHVVVVRQSTLDAQPDAVMTFYRAVESIWKELPKGSALPLGRAEIEPSVELALRYISAQKMLPRTMTPSEVWSGVPAGL